MRLIPQYHDAGTPAHWPATLGLIAVLILAVTLWWQLRAGPILESGGESPRPDPAAANRLRFKVRADGTISAGDEDTEVGLGAVAARLTGLDTTGPVEIVVAPRATGAAVDKLLARLRDAGVTRCTLVIDRTEATLSPSSGPQSDSEEGGPAS